MDPRRQFKFIAILEIHPTPCISLEVTGQTQCRLRRDTPAAVNYIADPRRGHTYRIGKCSHGQSKRVHEIVLQNLTR